MNSQPVDLNRDLLCGRGVNELACTLQEMCFYLTLIFNTTYLHLISVSRMEWIAHSDVHTTVSYRPHCLLDVNVRPGQVKSPWSRTWGDILQVSSNLVPLPGHSKCIYWWNECRIRNLVDQHTSSEWLGHMRNTAFPRSTYSHTHSHRSVLIFTSFGKELLWDG